MLKADLSFFHYFVVLSPAGKHESGTTSEGGDNWMLRNQFTLKWDLSMHINVKETHFVLVDIISDFAM